MEAFQLGVVLSLKDLLSNKLSALNSHWDDLKKRLGEADKDVQKVEAGFAKLASGATKLGAGLAIGFSLKPAIDEARMFEKELSMTAAISKVSASELEGLKDAAIEAGMATKFSPTEAMAGLTALASAGIQGADNLKKALIPALDLAAASAGKLSVDNAAADMAASMTSFSASGEKISDVFVNMANIASYRVEDLGAAWRGVNLAASSANQSLETTGAVMAALKNNGATVIESGEGVRMALTALKAPSIQAKQAMDYLGVSAYDKNSGKFRDLIDIFEDLKKATNGMAEADRNAILQKILHEGGIKAFQAVTKIGIAETRGYATTIGQTGTAHEFAATQIDNFDGAVQILQGNIQTLKVLLGQGLMPALKFIFQGFSAIISPIIDFLKTHPRFTQFIGILTALTAVILTLAGAVQMVKGAWMVLTVWTKKNIVLTGLLTTTKKAWLLTELLSHKALILSSGLFKAVGLTKMATAAKNMALTVSEYGLTAAVAANSAAWYANPLTWVVAGIVALIAVTVAAIYYWDQWTAWVLKAWQAMVQFKNENEILVGVITLLTFPLTGTIYLLATLYQHWDSIVSILKSAWQAVIDFKSEHELLIGVLSVLGGPITQMINGLISLVQYWEQITNAIGNAITNVKNFFGIKEDPNKVIQSGMDARLKGLNERKQALLSQGLTQDSQAVKALDQEIYGYNKQRETFQKNLKGQESYNSELKRLKDEENKVTKNIGLAKDDTVRADLFKRQQDIKRQIAGHEKDKTKLITAGGIEQLNEIKKKEEKEKQELENAKKGKSAFSASGLKDFKKEQKEIEKAKNAKPKKGTVEYDTISAFRKEENDIKKRMRILKRDETDLKAKYIGRKGELEKSMEWKGLQAQKEKLQEYQSLFQDLKDDQNYWTQKIQKTTNKTKIAEYTKELNKVQTKLTDLQKSKSEFLKGGSVNLKARTYSEYITEMSDKYKNNQMSGTQFALKSGLGMYGLLFDGLFGTKTNDQNKPESQKGYWNSSINWLKTIAEYLKPKAKVEAQADAVLNKKVGTSTTTTSNSSIPVSPTQSATQSYTVEKGDVLWKVAKAHGITTEELLAANPQIKNKNRIKPGETINIPVKTAPAVPTPAPVNQGNTNTNTESKGAKVDVKLSFMDKFMDFLGVKVKEEAGNY